MSAVKVERSSRRGERVEWRRGSPPVSFIFTGGPEEGILEDIDFIIL